MMEEKTNEFIETLVELLEQKKFSQLKCVINEMMPADLALLYLSITAAVPRWVKQPLIIAATLYPLRFSSAI